MRERQATLEGLRKYCRCSQRHWKTCHHPWTFSFKVKGHPQVRRRLNALAGKPAGYIMPWDEAQSLRDLYRSQMRAGTFAEFAKSTPTLAPRTFAGVADLFVAARKKPDKNYYVEALKRYEFPDGAVMQDLTLEGITKAQVDHIRATWVSHRPGTKGGRVAVNRLVFGCLRRIFNWAIEEGYTDHTPFKRHGATKIKMDYAAESGRERRLEGDEEQRLLAHANADLKDLIVAALETGCRRGELLSLQWSEVREDAITLKAQKTKTKRTRVIPVTATLKAILDRRRKGPDGQLLGPGLYVFGNDVGEQRKSVKTAWAYACAGAQIENLHFHDLRREFGCRLMESGASIHEVRDTLGHTNITMTNRYLATTGAGLQKAFERFEAHRGSMSGQR